MTGQPTFAPLLEGFFTQRLMRQRRASAHTIASYRDSFQMLLQFVHERLRKAPSALMLEDIDAPLVAAFLDDLEAKRRITARTRNLRLTAIHSFFRYVAFEAPANAWQTQRVLAIPAKRFTRTLVPFLSRPEVDALLAAPDQQAWSGRRDHALIVLAVQTGLRLSELTNLVPADLQLGAGAHVHVIGKGRKERCTPLSKSTRAVLTAWIRVRTVAWNSSRRSAGRISPMRARRSLRRHMPESWFAHRRMYMCGKGLPRSRRAFRFCWKSRWRPTSKGRGVSPPPSGTRQPPCSWDIRGAGGRRSARCASCWPKAQSARSGMFSFTCRRILPTGILGSATRISSWRAARWGEALCSTRAIG